MVWSRSYNLHTDTRRHPPPRPTARLIARPRGTRAPHRTYPPHAPSPQPSTLVARACLLSCACRISDVACALCGRPCSVRDDDVESPRRERRRDARWCTSGGRGVDPVGDAARAPHTTRHVTHTPLTSTQQSESPRQSTPTALGPSAPFFFRFRSFRFTTSLGCTCSRLALQTARLSDSRTAHRTCHGTPRHSPAHTPHSRTCQHATRAARRRGPLICENCMLKMNTQQNH